jgi:phosphohistidine phosphatase
MKTVIIVRHAKSSWANIGQTDFERPLNDRGVHDAPIMGKKLAARNLNIDFILSSTALRATQTASLLLSGLGNNNLHIELESKLYHAPSYLIDAVITELPANAKNVIIVCHNNGITDWVNEQTGAIVANMPTCGIASFTALEIDDWKDWPSARKSLNFVDYPKLAM